ncbi:U4/U6-U5 snRNP complex subunit prp31 [Thelotrema lepadinum]|nr:U4/U6-U5 snRNP complex subunit prp31 [Thelotrema lepadinum]
MATLADELLNDFEESGSEGDEEQQNGLLKDLIAAQTNVISPDVEGPDMEIDTVEQGEGGSNEKLLDGIEDVDDAEETKNQVEKMQLGGFSDVRSVTTLKKSLEPVLEVSIPQSFHCIFDEKLWFTSSVFQANLTHRVPQKIGQFQSTHSKRRKPDARSINDDPEYKLLVEANSLYASIDTQMLIVHKFIRDHYSTRYPELETLISGPIEYATAVAVIANGPFDKQLAKRTDNILNKPLQDILDRHTIFNVTTEATSTRGRELSLSELHTVLQGCQEMFYLDQSKKILSEYVQSRMSVFAPNTAALVGPITAAQLVNSAGGLTGLANMPNRNLPSLGTRKQQQAGFARNTGIRQKGFLYHSELFRTISDDYMKQAMRIVSGKLTLTARIDCVHSSPDGSEGERLKQDCLDRLDKLTGPPPNRGPKALPAPDDKPSRKRGGRKVRKMKEATAMTDMAKAKNRMGFNVEEQEVGYGTGGGTAGMGMIGQDDVGNIRALKVDQRTKAKLSKKNQGWGAATPLGGTASSLGGFGHSAGNASMMKAHGLRSSGVGGQTAGTASSIAFTPVQGLELVNPEAQKEMKRKRDAEDDRWFKGGTFTQIGGASIVPSNLTNGGFKVPPMPAKAKVNGDMGPPPAKKAA